MTTIPSSLDEKAPLSFISSNVFPVSLPFDDDLQAHEPGHTTDRKSVSVTAIKTTSMHQANRLMNSSVQVSSTSTSDTRNGETSTETRFVSTDKPGLVDNTKKTMSNLPSLSTISNSAAVMKYSVPSGTANTLERLTGIMSILQTTTNAAQVDLHYRFERTSVTTMAASELENLANDSSNSNPGSEMNKTIPASIVSKLPKTSTLAIDISTSEAAYGQFYSLIGNGLGNGLRIGMLHFYTVFIC